MTGRNSIQYLTKYYGTMIDKVLLYPYYLYLRMRDRYYSSPRRRLAVTDVPSVCVGNITVGGTGKTPHVEMILRMLLDSERWSCANLAVLSRGYKRESKGFQQVTADGSAAMFGDEPLQIKKKFPGVTVAVDKNRVEGCRLLCDPSRLASGQYEGKCWNRDFPPADYIILDDAYQYRKLKPTLSIVLVDYGRPVTEDMLLPLGRLRDLPQRLYDADVIIVSKCPEHIDIQEQKEFAASMGVMNYDPENCSGVSRKGRPQNVFFTYIGYLPVRGAFDVTDPRYAYARKAIMVSAIARDTHLRSHLSDSYKIVARFRFPDHHKFVWSDVNRVRLALRKDPTAVIMTTEKDIQRLHDFVGLPREIMERTFVVPIETRFVSELQRSVFNTVITEI